MREFTHGSLFSGIGGFDLGRYGGETHSERTQRISPQRGQCQVGQGEAEEGYKMTDEAPSLQTERAKKKHRIANRKWAARNRARIQAIQRSYKTRKLAAGLCVRCGINVIDPNSKTQCAACLKKSREASARSRQKHLPKVRKRQAKAMRAKRRSNPAKYSADRRAYYAKNRTRLLEQRRAKAGSIPREEYLSRLRSLKSNREDGTQPEGK